MLFAGLEGCWVPQQIPHDPVFVFVMHDYNKSYQAIYNAQDNSNKTLIMPIQVNGIKILTIISPRCSFSQFDRLTRDLDILPFASQKCSATHLDPAGHSVCTAAAF